MRILMITTEWPSPETPHAVPFITRQVEFLQHAGIDIKVFHFRGSGNPLNYLRAWSQVQKILADGHYDLIHAQWGQSAFPALPKRIPLVVTFRGSDLNGIVGSNNRYFWSGYLLSLFSRLVAQLADEAIVVSESMIKKLPKRKYCVIPSGLNLELFMPMDRSVARQLLGWNTDRKVVFFGGDPLVLSKRYALACNAVSLLEKDFPEIIMIPAKNIEHQKMPVYLNASDAMLLTSMHEGSPNIVKESLACDLPIVSTEVGDVRQRIGKIEGCKICENDHPETIALALKEILNRDKRIEGRATVQDLEESIFAEKIIMIYQRAISK